MSESYIHISLYIIFEKLYPRALGVANTSQTTKYIFVYSANLLYQILKKDKYIYNKNNNRTSI